MKFVFTGNMATCNWNNRSISAESLKEHYGCEVQSEPKTSTRLSAFQLLHVQTEGPSWEQVFLQLYCI